MNFSILMNEYHNRVQSVLQTAKHLVLDAIGDSDDVLELTRAQNVTDISPISYAELQSSAAKCHANLQQIEGMLTNVRSTIAGWSGILERERLAESQQRNQDHSDWVRERNDTAREGPDTVENPKLRAFVAFTEMAADPLLNKRQLVASLIRVYNMIKNEEDMRSVPPEDELLYQAVLTMTGETAQQLRRVEPLRGD